PVIGYLGAASPEEARLRSFRQGLKDIGYAEGENVSIVYRWAESQLERLPALAAELVRRRGTVIVTTGSQATHLAAKTANATLAIVFSAVQGPVSTGLVASLARPGGNLTGVNFFGLELGAKRLELLRELVPTGTPFAVLVNPANPRVTESILREVEPAARAL